MLLCIFSIWAICITALIQNLPVFEAAAYLGGGLQVAVFWFGLFVVGVIVLRFIFSAKTFAQHVTKTPAELEAIAPLESSHPDANVRATANQMLKDAGY